MRIICKDNFTYDDMIIFHKNEIYYFGCPKIIYYEKYVICDKNHKILWYIIDDYEAYQLLENFYTEQEYRKLKLEKINAKMPIQNR